MQLSLTTAIDVAKVLSIILGNPIFAVKTQSGPLECILTCSLGDEHTFLSIDSNRSLYVCCDKKKDSCFTSLENISKESVHNLRNYSNDLSNIATQVLGGFSTKTDFRHFHLPSKVRLLAYICKTEKIATYLKIHARKYQDIAGQTNAILPSIESLIQFNTVIKNALRHSHDEDAQAEHYNAIAMESLAKCFQSYQETKSISLKEIQRHELCKDLVIWGYANIETPLSLDLAIEQLHTTRASLSQGCKETMGIGPMEILRYIRLEHVYKALTSSKIRKQLNLQKVEEIREHYSFMSRGNFAGTYKTYFEESPKKTLMKSENN